MRDGVNGQIRVYGLVTGGILIGEVLVSNKHMVRLRHPAWFVTQNEKIGATPLVPVTLSNWHEISSDVKLSKVNVLYEATAPPKMVDLYEKVQANILKAATGLSVATAEDLSKLVSSIQ